MQAATLATGERHLLSPALCCRCGWSHLSNEHLKALPEQKNQPGSAPSESFGTKGLSSSEVGPVRLRDAGAGGKPSSIVPHPWPPKAGRTGICLSCFSPFSAIMIPCFSFQFLIGLETWSHSTGERKKKKIPTPLPDSSFCFHLLLQASELLC